MEIKPTGPATDLNSLAKSERTTSFPSKSAAASDTAALGSGEPAGTLKARFQKTDLQDPTKVNEMLSECADQLLQSALGQVKGQIPQADTQYLTDWLQNDPSIRGKLMSYLERVLT